MLATASAAYIYYWGWQKWNHLRAKRAFVFSEVNFLIHKNYHSLFLQPISWESEFFFYLNMPALFYASMLVERYLGMRTWVMAFTANCVTSALTQVAYQRHVGYKKYQRRGRMAK